MKKSEKGRTLTCLRKQRQRYNGAQDFVALAGQRFFPLRSSLALCLQILQIHCLRNLTYIPSIDSVRFTHFIPFHQKLMMKTTLFPKARVVVVQIKPVSKFRSTLPRNVDCKEDCIQFMINPQFQNVNYSDRW